MRFRQEAQSAARMAHPTIVRVFDAGSTVQVSWTQQSCPSGQTLSGYTITVSGGSIQGSSNPGQTSVGPGQTSVSVQVANTPGSNLAADFLYFCGQLSSPSSPTSTFQIQQ